MQKHLTTWQLIADSLQQNVAVMLLYVLESNGSSPGRQGFFMAVNAKGEMEGSIGGGMMEYKLVEMAKDKLQKSNEEALLRKQVHDKAAAKNQSGMICSGDQTVVLYKIAVEQKATIQQIIQCLEKEKNGTLALSPQGLSFSEANIAQQFNYTYISDDNWLYREKIGYIHHLHVIGGGHCSLPFCKLMNMLGFYIHLYEDRQDLKTFEANNFSHQKKIVADYSELKTLISNGEYNYVVVMTFGYRTDDIAVRALLGKEFKYFGLLGSKKKIEKMFSGYASENISPDLLKSIHAPVGMAIHSKTPEEIAVSIAAEIIAVKNKPNDDFN